MESGSIAKRYSRAFIELAQDSGTVDTVLNELLDFRSQLRASSALTTVMTNPSFLAAQRIAVLQEMVTKLGYSDLTRRFLVLLAEKRRMQAFEDIVREFQRQYDELKGLVRVSVTTAVPMDETLERQLTTQIEGFTGRKAVVTHQVDPTIIGGVVTRINDLLIDGSVATQLRRIQHSLLQEKTG